MITVSTLLDREATVRRQGDRIGTMPGKTQILPSLANCKEVKCSEAYGFTTDHKISSKAYHTFAEK